jgi:hypothetical protein
MIDSEIVMMLEILPELDTSKELCNSNENLWYSLIQDERILLK